MSKRATPRSHTPMDYSETDFGKASDQTLTEDAHAPGKTNRATETWGEFLRNPDSEVDELTDPWGAYLRKEWTRLNTKFQTRPTTFPELKRQITTGHIDETEWDLYTALKNRVDPPAGKAKNGRHKGSWELTLTYSPKWFQDDLEAQDAFRTAERKLLKYYADDMELYRSVGEYTADGRSHLHILYRLGSGGKFTDKNLRRAYPHWNTKIKVGKGNQGGHHAPCKSVSDYAGYIEKELTTAWHNYSHKNADDPTLA